MTRKLVAVKSINRNLNVQIPNEWDQDKGTTLRENQKEINKNLEKITNEETILKQLRHKNVVQFYEKLQAPIDNPTHDLYFMELCQGGDLMRYVRKR